MLAFGRKCQETKNWAGRIPFMLVAAHYDAAEYSEKGAWLRQPEVWAELQLFFENYLKEHPEAKFERAKYAKCAFDCERFEDADRLFAHLGEFDWVDVFDSAQAYQDARAEVQRRLTGAR